jgi:hypothetical protein
VADGDTNTVCRHCGNRLLLPWGVRRYISEDRIGRTGAARAVRDRLRETTRSLPEGSAVTTAVLYYVPFWSITCRVDGFVLGTRGLYSEREVETEFDPSGDGAKPVITSRLVKQRTGSEAVEQRVSLDLDLTVSAARLEPLGIPSLGEKTQMALDGMELGKGRLPDGLQVFDSANLPEGIVVDPVVGLGEAGIEAAGIVDRYSRGAGTGLEQRTLHLCVTGRRERLVYYPLWIVGFTAFSKRFGAVVDGRTGTVLSGRFPADPRKSRMLVTAAGALTAAIVPMMVHAFFVVPPVLRVLMVFGALTVVSAAGKALRFYGGRLLDAKNV